MAALIGLVAGAAIAVAVLQAGAQSPAVAREASGASGASEVSAVSEAPKMCSDERAPMYGWRSPPVVRVHTRPIIDYRAPSKLEEGGFRRIGTVTGQLDGKTEVLPLFSRPTIYGGRVNMHTRIGGFDGEPVSIQYQGKDCMADLGCAELYHGGDEPVYIEGLTTAPFTPYVDS